MLQVLSSGGSGQCSTSALRQAAKIHCALMLYSYTVAYIYL